MTPQPGDVLEFTRTSERVEVAETWATWRGAPMLQIRYPDDTETAISWPDPMFRPARRPLDPTPPGPPPTGEQTALDLEEIR